MRRHLGARSLFLAVLVSALLGSACLAAGASAYIYWANTNSIGRANNDGSGVDQNFIPAANGFQCGVAVDGGHIYWVSGASTIARANIDGSGLNQNFISGGSTICGVAVDATHIFWGNQGSNTIGRATLDGTNIKQNAITGAPGACGPAVGGGHIYWGNYGALSGTGKGNGVSIGRADLDANDDVSNVRTGFITGANGPCFVALDSGHLYWQNIGGGGGTAIGRANLDGTGVNQVAYAVPAGPCGLAIDATHLYWGNLAGGSGSSVGRANLDNSLLEPNFIGGAAQPCGVAIDSLGVPGGSQPPPSPSNQVGFGKLTRNTKDGSVTLVIEVPGPGDLAVKGKDVKVKWPAQARAARAVSGAGKVKVVIRAKGKAAKKLHKSGKVKVTAQITFTPTGGTSRTQTRKLKLVRHR